MLRRDFLKLSALFGAAGALPLLQACARRQQAEPDAPLRIGYLPITDAAPMLVAHARGLFAAHGVAAERPVRFRSWAQLVEAFIGGEVNVIHLLAPMTVWARYGSGAPVKTVMWNHLGGSALTVAPMVRQLADLGGRTVAIPFWYSIHNVLLQYLLRAHGLRATHKKPGAGEVKLMVMAPADMVAALAAGSVAGFIVAEPFNALAEAQGVGKVLRFSADVWRDHACCVTLMHEHDIDTRPQWVQGVVDALVAAQLWIRQHRADAARLLAKGQAQAYTPHEAEVLQRVLAPTAADWARYADQGVIVHPHWQQQRIDFQPYPFPSYTETLIGLLQQTHLAGDNAFLSDLQPQTAAVELVEPRFVRLALQQQQAWAAFGLPENLSRTEELAA